MTSSHQEGHYVFYIFKDMIQNNYTLHQNIKLTHLLTGCLEKEQTEKPVLYHSQIGCLKWNTFVS